jgi:branched-chain amino acid transport system ATP-binding protein
MASADTLTAIKKLAEVDKLPAAFGISSSTICFAACGESEKYKMVLLTTTATNPGLGAECPDWFYRVMPSDAGQGIEMVRVLEHFGVTEAPIMYINNDYGIAVKDAFVAEMERKGYTVTLEQPFEWGATELRSIFGLADFATGEIILDGEDINGLKTHQHVQKGIAFVPQERNIFSSLTVEENLEMGVYGVGDGQLEENRERVFERFPILKERRTQRAGTLSGGERRMLAVSVGLMSDPKIMLLDEPSLGLAPQIVASLFAHIEDINEAGTTILLVEQNARQALAIADRGYVLDLGKIEFSGGGQEMCQDERIQKTYLGRA